MEQTVVGLSTHTQAGTDVRPSTYTHTDTHTHARAHAQAHRRAHAHIMYQNRGALSVAFDSQCL